MQIEINEEAIVEAAAEKVAHEFLWAEYGERKRHGTELVKRVKEIIEEKVARGVEEHLEKVPNRIEQIVEKILEAGFPQTNNYGEPTGRTLTLEERVREKLFGVDRYAKKSWLDQHAKTFVQKKIDGELKSLFEEAREKMKLLMDATLLEKLAKSMREGIGLR